MKHVLNLHSLPDSVWDVLIGEALKHAENRAYRSNQHPGKHMGLVFFNDSLRTRVSMELAAAALGATPVTVTPGSGTWGFAWEKGRPMLGGEAEHIQEAVGVLSRYVDALGVRLFASGTDRDQDREDALLQQFAAASAVPVLNLESASRHPCQALADAAVLTRHFDGHAKGKKFVLSWTNHPKALPMAVPNSTLFMAARLGMDVTVARPDGFELESDVMEKAAELASSSGGRVQESNDLQAAVLGAQVIYAKSWGAVRRYEHPEAEAKMRQSHRDWRITESHMHAGDNAQFMHCLPVRRGVVVDDAVLDGSQTLHLDQAEFRLHGQKALLDWMWEGKG